MFSRLIAFVLGLAALVVGLLCFWPQLFALQRANPWAFAVASRGAAVAVALIAIVVIAILGILGRSVRRMLRPVGLWLLIFAVGSAVIVVNRGWTNVIVKNPVPNQLTVFSWNTMGAGAGAKSIADQALAAHADIVSLPETTASVGKDIAAMMTEQGHPMAMLSRAFDNTYKAHSTVLLISTQLGTYTLDDTVGTTSTSPSIVAHPARAGSPVIVAAHAISPSPKGLGQWRDDLGWLAKRCTQPNIIMAGDFNASVDNLSGLGPSAMGNCGDVALALGAGSIGTWPSNIPALLGTQIDHVFYSAEWKATGITIDPSFTHKTSDHRPVIATLVPVAN